MPTWVYVCGSCDRSYSVPGVKTPENEDHAHNAHAAECGAGVML
jgi:hypothetical protein